MTNVKLKYTEAEVFEIFREQHRLCSPLDQMSDENAVISMNMTIADWRDACDLVGWAQLASYLNREFRIDVSMDEWYQVLEPSENRQLKDVCGLISEHAEKITYAEKNLFGTSCLKAGVFLTLKKNLQDKGVDVSELRPSSSLSEYLTKNFSPVMEEITHTGTKPINKIEVQWKPGFWNKLKLWDSKRFSLITGDVKTFRDLVERIVEEQLIYEN